ncbi:hypothetical protein GIB67_028989, partial [Kingdonia uniflora]
MLKGLDRIGAISYNYYNSALISAFAQRWQPETNSFHFKWGKMTPTLDDVEQLVGLPADGDATDLNALKFLKAGGAGNLLSLRKLKEHYAYKLEKVLSDGTIVAAKKKKGLTTKFVAHAYMMYVLGSFPFPFSMKKGANVSTRYLYLFAKEKLAKKWSRGSAGLTHMYYNLGATSRDDGRQFACCTTLLESWIFTHFPKLAGIPKEMNSNAYEHCTCWKWDVSVTDRYSGTALLKFREVLDNYKLKNTTICPITIDLAADDDEYGDTPVHQSEDVAEQYDASTSECDMLKETIEKMNEDIELKRVVDEQYALEFADLPRQLDMKPVPDVNLTKKYEDLLAAHEDVTKKLIAIEDFIMNWTSKYKKEAARYTEESNHLQQKLVNAEERMKSLEANNSEW